MPGMATWECPACAREFGKAGQSHVCAPAMSAEAYFAGRERWEREVFEAVAEHLHGLGPVVVEAVTVGIFFKRVRTFAELRPKRGRVELSVVLRPPLEHPRVRRSVRATGSTRAYYIDLRTAADVDDMVKGWLTQSYLR